MALLRETALNAFVSDEKKRIPMATLVPARQIDGQFSDYSDPVVDSDDDLLIDEETVSRAPKVLENQYRALILENVVDSESMFFPESATEGDPTFSYVSRKDRNTLVSWMVRVSDEIKFLDDTLFLSISLFDRARVSYHPRKSHLQLMAATCLWIASKMEESLTPALSDFCYLCSYAYRSQEFIRCERMILTKLNFAVASPTPIFYIEGMIPADDEDCKRLARYFALTALFSESYGDLSPSAVAISALFLANAVTGEAQRLPLCPVAVNSVITCVNLMIDVVAEIILDEEGWMMRELLICADIFGFEVVDLV
jgi:hypothetical protein